MFWRWYTYFTLAVGTSVVIWFSIGGFRDLRKMYALLAQRRTDARDDGTVSGQSAESGRDA